MDFTYDRSYGHYVARYAEHIIGSDDDTRAWDVIVGTPDGYDVVIEFIADDDRTVYRKTLDGEVGKQRAMEWITDRLAHRAVLTHGRMLLEGFRRTQS